MNTQEMHERLLANLIKLTGKSADELVPGLHKAGEEAHAAGDPAVEEVHRQFTQGMADELGLSYDDIEKYTPMYDTDRPRVLAGLAKETGKTEQDIHEVFSKVGGKYGPAKAKAVADSHEGFVVRAAKELGLDRSIIEKAFEFGED
ncbi:MAG: hypothetical protein PUK40_01530 [Actinomycetaceae bacterium]|nr:hypothetical protein [Arcanobacterium sp.]MDD7504624.1 hypothetical protein [Actinomycetaceae bacterium]MDY6143060.1 hypothetical protein [Arcanobacterium sp.]